MQLQKRSFPPLAEITGSQVVSTFRDQVAKYLEQSGLTMRHLTARHGSLIQSTDETVALNAVKLGYQLHGMNDETAPQQQGDIIMQVNIVNVPTQHDDKSKQD